MERTQSQELRRVDGVEGAAVLWGVALRPSRPSSAQAVRVERRLAHRRVAGPRKLCTRRARTVGPSPRHEAAPTRGVGVAATARAPPPRGRAQERTTETPSRRRSPEDGAAWRPAPREGARSARRLPPSQSLVNRRRPVLSVMVVASRPFDMVPDGLRAQSGQLFGGRGLLCGGRGARCAAEAGVEH